MDTILFEFQTFAFNTEVCEMSGNFRLQNGLNLHCRLWPCGPGPKQTNVWSQLEAPYDFQNLWLLFKKCDFLKISKNSFSFTLLVFLSQVHHAVNIQKMFLLKIWLKTGFSREKKCVFTFLSNKN